MRLCLIAVAIFAGLSAAMSSCPYSNEGMLYNTTDGCGDCAKAYCTCVGGDCAVAAKDCATAVKCARENIKCMNDAADTLACQSTLKTALLEFAASSAAAPVYNNSDLNMACKNAVCKTMNQSATDICGADIPYYATCVSPLAKTYTAKISGDFSLILNDPILKARFRILLQNDMSKHIGTSVIISAMYAGSLIVEFYVDPAGLTTAQLAAFEAAVLTLADNVDWMADALAYAEVNGVDITNVAVESITETTDGVQPPPTPSDDDDEACGSGCVAGIVVAVVVVVIIVVIVVVFVTKKSPEEGDGQKSEPITANEEMSKV